jgi:hypothetical protein
MSTPAPFPVPFRQDYWIALMSGEREISPRIPVKRGTATVMFPIDELKIPIGLLVSHYGLFISKDIEMAELGGTVVPENLITFPGTTISLDISKSWGYQGF